MQCRVPSLNPRPLPPSRPSPCTPKRAASNFGFVEPYGVTYWAVSSRAWITHGALTAPLGLTATLMYGFSAPDGASWIMAGSVPGVVSDVAASGAWTGYLFGLVQVCCVCVCVWVCWGIEDAWGSLRV